MAAALCTGPFCNAARTCRKTAHNVQPPTCSAAETDRSPNPPERPDVRRLVFCSGKIYYELEQARANAGAEREIAICRVEQLAPFPFDLAMRELKRYPNAHVRCCSPACIGCSSVEFCVCRFVCVICALWNLFGVANVGSV